jgi:hypothetical protein
MVDHEIRVQGMALNGVAQARPALLQMNAEDFPARFLTDLGALAITPGSSVATLATSPTSPVTLYQPVQRIVHVALLDLTCESIGFPRVDPTHVESAGVVIRRVLRNQGADDYSSPPSAWMKSPDGQFQWSPMTRLQERQDPDPIKRPVLHTGQAVLDSMLAQQTLATAQSEVFTPAYVAPPKVGDAAGHTFVYAVIPTASSDLTTNPPSAPQYDAGTLSKGLPNLLTSKGQNAPFRNGVVNYRYMSDEYAKSQGASSFQSFSAALTFLYSVAGAFQNSPQAQALIAGLNKFNVYDKFGAATSMGTFYQQAAADQLDYDPAGGHPMPSLTMPDSWDMFSDTDAATILNLITPCLQSRSLLVAAPLGRFQDSTRFYRLRIFLRMKGKTPQCPTDLVWSKFSDPFRIAAWYESAGRSLAPVPLPDPTDRNFLKNAKPNCAFAVPASLMNAMSGSTLSGLSSGSAPAGPGISLNWICGFSIPIITICAFFVLNIFLVLLNLVFFWLPFIKICIPFPLPTPANSGESNGT